MSQIRGTRENRRKPKGTCFVIRSVWKSPFIPLPVCEETNSARDRCALTIRVIRVIRGSITAARANPGRIAGLPPFLYSAMALSVADRF